MPTAKLTEQDLEALQHGGDLPRFVFFPIGLLSIWASVYPWPIAHWSVQLAWMCVTAYVFFCWSNCFHETSHQTLFGSKKISVVLGRLLGCFQFLPYSVYRETHTSHHAYLNTPNDWELWPYSDPTASLRFRRIWVWIDLVFGCITVPYVYSRIYFHKNSPIKSPALCKTITLEYMGLFVFWTVTICTVAIFGLWKHLICGWAIPYFICGIYHSIRKFSEHLGIDSYDQLMGARTVVGGNPFTRILSFVNFDSFLHGVHHRHPRVAHVLLEATLREHMAANPDKHFPVYDNYLASTLDGLPWMIRNPGVGLNLGAPLPDSIAKQEKPVTDRNSRRVDTASQASATAAKPHWNGREPAVDYTEEQDSTYV